MSEQSFQIVIDADRDLSVAQVFGWVMDGLVRDRSVLVDGMTVAPDSDIHGKVSV